MAERKKKSNIPQVHIKTKNAFAKRIFSQTMQKANVDSPCNDQLHFPPLKSTFRTPLKMQIYSCPDPTFWHAADTTPVFIFYER